MLVKNIFCIAAGQEQTRKTTTTVNRKHLYLNYGLLSLASSLEKMGFEPIQIQGNFDSPDFTFHSCIELGMFETDWPILISIPSFYALSWARAFIFEVRRFKPNQKIIVGGRWVVGGQPQRLSEVLGGVDLVVDGVGEDVLFNAILKFAPKNRNAIIPVNLSRGVLHPLNYNLLHLRKMYQPSIEIARGCGMGCSFCQEREEQLTPLKKPVNIINEVAQTIIEDEYGSMTPYLEASVFVPSRSWAEEFRKASHDYLAPFEWRTEARVDSISPDVLEILAECGLKVLDIGLESASEQQLMRMKKTKNPRQYLDRASKLLKKAHSLGVAVKVNVLLFAGETNDSIAETTNWLELHRECVSGVSVGPVMGFGWPESIHNYINELAAYGASSASNQSIFGVHHLNLSEDIDYNDSLEISKNISRSFMSAEQYYFLKKFSYLPRDYGFDQFSKDVLSYKGSYSFNTDSL
jgi:radical SAM superfamily enzyme YgiQ (UPF0313 family)